MANTKKTSETPRVPSNVPNDYDHLGVPGSLNMPLREPRKRLPHAQRRGRTGLPSWFKAMLTMGCATSAFGLLMVVLGIMLFPSYYRGLEPRFQASWDHRFERFGIDLRDLLLTPVPTGGPTLEGLTSREEAQERLFGDLTAMAQTDVPGADVDAPLVDGALSSGDETGLDGPIQTQGAETLEAMVTPSPTAGGGLEAGMVPTAPPDGAVPQPTPSPLPALPTATPGPTAYIPPTQIPIPPQARLDNIRWEAQNWNNCGPTTMTMALTYFGYGNKQDVAADWMKPHYEDKNVSPWQMVRFVNENTAYRALYRIGGTTQLLKQLVAAGFPVVIEKGFQPAGEDWMGHYLLVMGYDDYGQNFLAFDSYEGSNNGKGRPQPYSTFDAYWRHFNRVFIVVYRPEQENKLREALGPYVDPNYASQIALETARNEVARDGEDKWAWFNMGTSYVRLGEYENAAYAYDVAYQLYLPWRMLWYQFGPYEAYFQTRRYDDVLTLAGTNENITPYVEETYYWQGMVFAARGETDRAIAKFNQALRYNRNFFPAQEAIAQVESGTFSLAAVAP